MSDQLSKVDLKLLQDVVSNILWPNGGTYAEEVQAIIDRIESAAAPVEVDDTEAALRYIRDWCPDSVKDHVATLARQLAEATTEIAAHERNDLAATDLIHSLQQRLEQAESQLVEATRRVADLQAVADEYNAFIHHQSAGGDFDSFMRERYPDPSLQKEPAK